MKNTLIGLFIVFIINTIFYLIASSFYYTTWFECFGQLMICLLGVALYEESKLNI